MSDREAIRWAWISKCAAIAILAFAIGMGIMGSVSETRANIAQRSQP